MARASRAGFSLLEVLGAVAILGIWFTMISEISMIGLRNEGRSHRALMASLVIDEVLHGIELRMLKGQWPKIESSEQERDDYTIRIEVEPYELELPESEGSPRNSGDRLFEHLAGPNPEAPSPLLSVRIEVAWQEGNYEDSVTRYTFSADLSKAKKALAGLRKRRQSAGDLPPSVEGL